MTATFRPVTGDDADEFAALQAAIEADRPTNTQIDAAEFRELLGLGSLHVEGAWHDGRLVGWDGFFWRPPDETTGEQTLLCFAEAHPTLAPAALDAELVRRVVASARERHRLDAGGAMTLVTRVASHRADALGTRRRAGFEAERFRFTMVAELGAASVDPLPERLAADFDLVTFDLADSETLRLAHNLAFAGYPNFTPMDDASWRGFMVDASHARHDLSSWFRSRSDGSVAAYLFAHEYAVPLSGRTDGREYYVPYLGTVPGRRGRGLAGALLRQTMASGLAAGYARSSLEVDASNPTGALGLYERSGYAVTTRFDELFLRG